MTHLPRRFDAIDSARGIGIILVVSGHAWRGAFGAGLIPDTSLFKAIDDTIYAFHMPLFFFLSGLLFLETLSKYQTGTLLKGRVTRLLWPMALWTWLFFGVKLLGGGALNSPVTLADAPIVPLPPYEHLWFLWALFLCHTLLILLYAPVLKHLPAKPLRFLLGGLGLGLAILLPYLPVPSLIWGPMVAHLPYFLIGMAIADEQAEGWGAKIGAFFAVFAFVLHIALLLLGMSYMPPAMTSCLLLIFAWMAWPQVDRARDAAVLRLLRYLGKMSMVIYLTHTIFSAALRIGMLRVGADDLALVLLATTIIGLVAPLGVMWAARKLRIVKLLGF
ncbi:acyltransferase [Sulfitobacter sp. HNIBRBA2951]|uniref:acyltransferase n=1 Tax=Sulfitobacter aquimarinus TaxID=3158557 RepID=UPI0032DF5B6F